MDNRSNPGIYMPTLRLSIIDSCNGKCPFCHREGQSEYCSRISLKKDTLYESIIPAIIKLSIQKVILTGGEPSLHLDLPEIAKAIRLHCPSVHLGLTTNGYNLKRIAETVDYLDRLTISMSSFKKDVYMNYTQVNPYEVMNTINKLNLRNKAVSIVVTDDNTFDIEEMIVSLSSQSYDVKLQFVIDDGKSNVEKEYRIIRLVSNLYGEPTILLQSTPSLLWKTQYKTIVRLKLASLNCFIYDRIIHREMCENCNYKENCVERGCAIRVYPNGDVSPCLNNHYLFTEHDIRENIEKAYAVNRC